MVWSPGTRLVILRGPSGSGKTTIARALRAELGRGTALIEQDHVRRVLLWEWDSPDALNIDLIDTIARRTLAAERSTIIEGILTDDHYGRMLRALIDDHPGATVCAYLDIPFDETVRRHATRAQSTQFTADDMATWWASSGPLGVDGEMVIDHRHTAADVVQLLRRSLRAS